MTQQRKKRILIYEIRITIMTDWLQQMAEQFMDAFITAMIRYDEQKGRVTKYEVTKRVLDGKTFEEIKKLEA